MFFSASTKMLSRLAACFFWLLVLLVTESEIRALGRRDVSDIANFKIQEALDHNHDVSARGATPGNPLAKREVSIDATIFTPIQYQESSGRGMSPALKRKAPDHNHDVSARGATPGTPLAKREVSVDATIVTPIQYRESSGRGISPALKRKAPHHNHDVSAKGATPGTPLAKREVSVDATIVMPIQYRESSGRGMSPALKRKAPDHNHDVSARGATPGTPLAKREVSVDATIVTPIQYRESSGRGMSPSLKRSAPDHKHEVSARGSATGTPLAKREVSVDATIVAPLQYRESSGRDMSPVLKRRAPRHKQELTSKEHSTKREAPVDASLVTSKREAPRQNLESTERGTNPIVKREESFETSAAMPDQYRKSSDRGTRALAKRQWWRSRWSGTESLPAKGTLALQNEKSQRSF